VWETGFRIVTVSVWIAAFSKKGGGILWLKGLNGIGDRECFGIFASLRMTARTNNGKNKRQETATVAATATAAIQRQMQWRK
jgi:hypothetical protein